MGVLVTTDLILRPAFSASLPACEAAFCTSVEVLLACKKGTKTPDHLILRCYSTRKSWCQTIHIAISDLAKEGAAVRSHKFSICVSLRCLRLYISQLLAT